MEESTVQGKWQENTTEIRERSYFRAVKFFKIHNMSVVNDSGNEEEVEVGYDSTDEDDYNVDKLS